MVNEKKMIMVEAASHAMSYKTKKPHADAEEVIRHVLGNIKGREFKIFGVAAADYVLKYLSMNPGSPEKKVMQSLVNEMDKILYSIENQGQENY